MLPVLLHDLNNHTQYLSALASLTGAGEAPPRGGDGLARTGQEVEELGWLLGLCAGGFGTDLLHDRTERRGLPPLVALVRKVLRRAGHDIERADRELPDLPTRVGWRGAWRVGELLHACALVTDAPLAWELCAADAGLRLDCYVDRANLPADVLGTAILEEDAHLVRFHVRAETVA